MKSLLHNRSTLPGAVLTLVFTGAALISLFWVPYDTTVLNIADRMKLPSLVHPFGTDQFGRDILSMLMVGARTSIAVALVAVGIGMLAGVEIHQHPEHGSLGVRAQTEMFWKGLHIKFTGNNGIVAPMFISEKSHIDEIVTKFRATLDALPH